MYKLGFVGACRAFKTYLDIVRLVDLAEFVSVWRYNFNCRPRHAGHAGSNHCAPDAACMATPRPGQAL